MSQIITLSEEIQIKILNLLDGWQLTTETPPNNNTNQEEINPFMSNSEINNIPNKTITLEELNNFYETCFDKALVMINRLNIDDFTPAETRIFKTGVCYWTASDLWNKYNIRVNNEDMEDTYVQSYGGLLYKQAMEILESFIDRRVMSLNKKIKVWTI